MDLFVQPDSGLGPVITGIRSAQKSIALTVFRLDRPEILKALEAAVGRGVSVRALVAHQNGKGEKDLRKLELGLLEAGVTLSRTGDDLLRYHDKLMIVDEQVLYVLGFNFTRLDMERSRSFGVSTKDRAVVQEAIRLFEADAARQAYVSNLDALVVSPENARERLAGLIGRTRRQLLIYDPKLNDPAMVRLILERERAGVEVRILGRGTQKLKGQRLQKPKRRLHVRAIIADGRLAFVGSQSLRKAELDQRREVGIVVRDLKTVKRLASVFEQDWSETETGREEAKKDAEPTKAETSGSADDEPDGPQAVS